MLGLSRIAGKGPFSSVLYATLSNKTSPYHFPEIWQYFSITSSYLTPSKLLLFSPDINFLAKVFVTLKIPPVKSELFSFVLYS